MSPYRTLLDDLARPWNAWDVIPASGERRTTDRRTQAQRAGTRIVERRASERRRVRGLRISLPPRRRRLVE